MTSDAQRAANRHNALAAGGPVTTAGKERSRRNRLRHGLAASAVMVLPDEDAHAFEQLCEALHRDLAPQDALQEQLVERVAMLFWRLARASRLESALYAYRALVGEREAIRHARFERDRAARPGYANGPRSPMTPQEAERATEIDVALPAVAIAPVFLEDLRKDRALQHLSRYERGLERSLETTLAALAHERRIAAQERAAAAIVLDPDGDPAV